MLRTRIVLGLSVALVTAGCGGSATPSPTAVSSPVPVSTPAQTTRSAAAPSSGSASPAVTSARAPTVTRTGRPAPVRAAHPTRRPQPQVADGETVVLNPGHDGGNESHAAEIARQVPAGFGAVKACDTTGTNTAGGYPEHAFTWDVALRVRALLRSGGVHVILTRPNDTGVGPCVDRRAAIGNERGVAAVVSIHADGAPAGGHGFHVNQCSRTPDGATAATARRSDLLGRDIHAALVRSSGLVPSTYIGHDGYVYRSDLAGLNLATNPATFLELGNMRNAGDAALLTSAAGRQRIARAIAAGILAYLTP